jgi:hypothetical protein
LPLVVPVAVAGFMLEDRSELERVAGVAVVCWRADRLLFDGAAFVVVVLRTAEFAGTVLLFALVAAVVVTVAAGGPGLAFVTDKPN